MITIYVVHDGDGKIARAGRINVLRIDEIEVGGGETRLTFSGINLPNPSLQYIDAGELVDRPEFTEEFDVTEISADGVDEATLINIPVGSKMTTGNVVTPIDDGEFILTVDSLGPHDIMLQSFPNQTKWYRINGTA